MSRRPFSGHPITPEVAAERDAEAKRADAAEAELAQLRDELEKLRGR